MTTPMRSFTADRLRPKWADLIVVVLLIAGAVVLMLALRPESGGDLTAVVTLEGTEIARQKLDGLEETILLPVEGTKYPITIQFDPGQVRVYHTDCPGGDCRATGWLSRAGGQIVCLPNRLVVSLVSSQASDIDAVTG